MGLAHPRCVCDVYADPDDDDITVDGTIKLCEDLGVDPEDLELSVHHVLTKGIDATEVIIETDDGVDLLPATIELARAELRDKGRHAGMGAGLFGAGGLVALYGVGALVLAVIFLLALVMPDWVAALIVGVVLLLRRRRGQRDLFAAIAARRGDPPAAGIPPVGGSGLRRGGRAGLRRA